MYELAYRIDSPLGPLVFDGSPIGGSATITTRDLRPLFVVPPDVPPADILVWQGELRAASTTLLNDRIADLETFISNATQADLLDPAGPTYANMRIVEWFRLRPLSFEPSLGLYIQPAEINVQQS